MHRQFTISWFFGVMLVKPWGDIDAENCLTSYFLKGVHCIWLVSLSACTPCEDPHWWTLKFSQSAICLQEAVPLIDVVLFMFLYLSFVIHFDCYVLFFSSLHCHICSFPYHKQSNAIFILLLVFHRIACVVMFCCIFSCCFFYHPFVFCMHWAVHTFYFFML